MATIQKLISAAGNKKIGNHKKQVEGITTKYIYHWTAICTVNESTKTFVINNGGYGTRSTTRAINDYKRQLTSKGYALVS